MSLDWDEEMAKAQPHDCVPLPSNHPLYILYTSGTTGTPKVLERLWSLIGNAGRSPVTTRQEVTSAAAAPSRGIQKINT